MRLLERVFPAAESERPALPDYALLRLIGRGSYGDVWIARSVTGAYRAVKIVWRSRFEDAQPYEREFKGLTEFAAISLEESRQLALLHVSRTPDFFYYVMELADDRERGRDIDPATYQPRTLKDLVEGGQPLPAADVLRLAIDLTQALSGLHTRGLVHRDIKPSNVIFVSHVPKLADIGLVATASAGLTFVGTEGYVPPEGPGAPAADVYSLGKVLYELATGMGRNDYPRLPAYLHTRADRKALLELNEIIIRACAPHPEDRYRDAGALLEELQLLQAGKSVRRLRSAERRLGRALRLAAALAVIATIAGVGAWLENKRAAKAESERDAIARRSLYSANLSRAQRAVDIDDLGRARTFLKEAAENDRLAANAFEWGALWHMAQGDPAKALLTQATSVSRVSISSDGRHLAIHSSATQAEVVELPTEKVVRRIDGMLRLAGFSSDGTHLIGLGKDLRPRMWSLSDGSQSEPIAPGTNRLVGLYGAHNVVLFTDSSSAASHTLRGWDMSESRELFRYPIDATGSIRPDFFRAALSADGHLVALVLLAGRMSSATWELRVMETFSGRMVLPPRAIPRATELGFTSDAKSLILAYSPDELVSIDVDSGREQWRTRLVTGQIDALTPSPDGALIALGGRDGRLHLVSASDGVIVDQRKGHSAGISTIVWLPDGSEIVSGSQSGEVRQWTRSRFPEVDLIHGLWNPTGGGRRVCVSPAGEKLAATLDGETIAVILGSPGEIAEKVDLKLPIGFTNGMALIGISKENSLTRYTAVKEMEALATFDSDLIWGTPSMNRTGTVVALPDTLGTLHLWNRASGQVTRRLAHAGGCWWSAMDRAGELVATGGQDLLLKLWSVKGGHAVAESETSGAACATFSPTQDWLAIGLRNGVIEIRNLPELSLRRKIRTTSSAIRDCISADYGNRLIAAGTNGSIHIIATDTWEEVATFRVEPGRQFDTTVDRLALSENGNLLGAYTNDGRLKLWRTSR